MPRKIIREFPRELRQGPWPLIQVSPKDRSYVPARESKLARRLRLMRMSLDLLFLDLANATLKGTILGIFAFAATFSFITLHSSGFCWLVGWHWALAIGGILVLLFLIGLDITLLIITAIALWLSFGAMIAHPLILLLFIAGGILLQWIIELLPAPVQAS